MDPRIVAATAMARDHSISHIHTTLSISPEPEPKQTLGFTGVQTTLSVDPDSNVVTAGSTSTHPLLRPRTMFQSLPKEVVLMIAEACIQPFDIKVVRVERSDGATKLIVEGPNGLELRLVSREFNIDIQKSIMNKFSGKLDLTKGTTSFFNDSVMEKEQQAWLRDLVTTIIVRFTVWSPPKWPYAEYKNLQLVELLFCIKSRSGFSQGNADMLAQEIRVPTGRKRHVNDLSAKTLPDIKVVGYFPAQNGTDVADLSAFPAQIMPSLNYLRI